MNMLILLMWIAGLTFAIGVIVGEHLQRAREEIFWEALEETSERLWKHHEIGFIRRAAEQLTGTCELCNDGIFERIEALRAGEKKP